MQKILPSLTRDFLEQIPLAFQMNFNDVLSREEFEMLFDPNMGMTQNSIPKPSALKMQNQQKGKQGNDELTALVKYLSQCLDKEGTTPL
jgi:Ca2+-binding EF-hand superfamily protein